MGNPANLIDPSGLLSESQKQEIIEAWGKAGSLAGAIIGFLTGGGGGFLTGPGAAAAVPAGAYAGAVAGGITAEILANGVLHISASMQGRWWENTDEYDDECQGGKKKMPQGDNTAKNKQFDEALRRLGIEKGTDAARKVHDLITNQGLQSVKEILKAAREVGLGR